MAKNRPLMTKMDEFEYLKIVKNFVKNLKK